MNSEQEKDKTLYTDQVLLMLSSEFLPINYPRLFIHLYMSISQETGVEMELEENMPLLEWLANNYKKFGAGLEIITDRSQEGSQYVRGFGGIGGMLRYTVDFQV